MHLWASPEYHYEGKRSLFSSRKIASFLAFHSPPPLRNHTMNCCCPSVCLFVPFRPWSPGRRKLNFGRNVPRFMCYWWHHIPAERSKVKGQGHRTDWSLESAAPAQTFFTISRGKWKAHLSEVNNTLPDATAFLSTCLRDRYGISVRPSVAPEFLRSPIYLIVPFDLPIERPNSAWWPKWGGACF